MKVKKLRLDLDLKPLKIKQKDQKNNNEIVLDTLAMLHRASVEKKKEKGQTRDQATMWGYFLKDCYGNNGLLLTELEVSDEKWQMLKDLINNGPFPTGCELVLVYLIDWMNEEEKRFDEAKKKEAAAAAIEKKSKE